MAEATQAVTQGLDGTPGVSPGTGEPRDPRQGDVGMQGDDALGVCGGNGTTSPLRAGAFKRVKDLTCRSLSSCGDVLGRAASGSSVFAQALRSLLWPLAKSGPGDQRGPGMSGARPPAPSSPCFSPQFGGLRPPGALAVVEDGGSRVAWGSPSTLVLPASFSQTAAAERSPTGVGLGDRGGLSYQNNSVILKQTLGSGEQGPGAGSAVTAALPRSCSFQETENREG